jgi:ATP-dependent protease ClpP protease subunit
VKDTRGITALNQERTKFINYVRNQNPELATQISALKAPRWFKLKNSTDDDGEEIADLYIYDEIMPHWMAEFLGGVSAEGLIQQLNEISASSINVRINSPGGAVFEAIAIYNALVSHSATINVYVDSLAASAASVVAMAGDKITMMVGSQLMIHDAMGVEMGNAAELRAFADFLDKQSDNIASIYAEKSGGDAKDFRALMLAETWMFPEEAVELGLADEVYSRPKNVAPEETEEEKEESSEDDEEEEEEKETPVEDLMNRKHPLAARFKYAGRKRAPSPVSEENTDELVAVFRSFLGGK